MNGGHPVSMLMFGTLIAALALAVFILSRFFRKPSNQHPMRGEPERNIDQIRGEASTTDV